MAREHAITFRAGLSHGCAIEIVAGLLHSPEVGGKSGIQPADQPDLEGEVMSLILILLILLLLLGGGGFYAGGPRVGISLGGIILLIIIFMAVTGRL
jgi:hypothetical protein